MNKEWHGYAAMAAAAYAKDLLCHIPPSVIDEERSPSPWDDATGYDARLQSEQSCIVTSREPSTSSIIDQGSKEFQKSGLEKV